MRKFLASVYSKLRFVFGSVADPDAGVFWIQIWNPDPDPGAYNKI